MFVVPPSGGMSSLNSYRLKAELQTRFSENNHEETKKSSCSSWLFWPSEAVIQTELQHATAKKSTGDLAELGRSDRLSVRLIVKGPGRMIEDVRGVHAKHQFVP